MVVALIILAIALSGLFFLRMLIYMPGEPPAERGKNRGDLEREADNWYYDLYGNKRPVKDWQDPRVARAKWAQENPCHSTLYSGYHDPKTGKVIRNGGRDR